MQLAGRHRGALAGVLGAAGLALAGYGAYTHQSALGPRCDGCEPWHPLLVVAPLVFGLVLVSTGGYLAASA